MIRFKHALGTTTLNDEVKGWSYEKLKATYEGKLDYVSLAKQLGIKPTPEKTGSVDQSEPAKSGIGSKKK